MFQMMKSVYSPKKFVKLVDELPLKTSTQIFLVLVTGWNIALHLSYIERGEGQTLGLVLMDSMIAAPIIACLYFSGGATIFWALGKVFGSEIGWFKVLSFLVGAGLLHFMGVIIWILDFLVVPELFSVEFAHSTWGIYWLLLTSILQLAITVLYMFTLFYGLKRIMDIGIIKTLLIMGLAPVIAFFLYVFVRLYFLK